MTTALLILAVAVLTIGGLWLAHRTRPSARAPLFATVALGAAAYFVMGWPGLGSTPARHQAPVQLGAPLDDLRARLTTQGSRSAVLLNFADSLIRNERGGDAARMLERAVERRPRDPDLWLGYANALVAASDGRLSPAAEAAYARAAALAPGSPGPALFRATALGKTDPEAARAEFARLLASAPPNAWWRARVEQRLASLPPAPTQPRPDSE